MIELEEPDEEPSVNEEQEHTASPTGPTPTNHPPEEEPSSTASTQSSDITGTDSVIQVSDSESEDIHQSGF